MIRVMIVDDYPFMRYGLRALLDVEADIEVIAECVDGQQAVELADDLQLDVVVTDLKMPRLDGADLAAHLLQHRPDVRIVVLTSEPHSELAARATAAGAHAVLSKNTDPGVLLAAVRS